MSETKQAEEAANRSKKQQPKKRGSKSATNQQELILPEEHFDLVRLIRFEPKKPDSLEDQSRVLLSKTAKATQLQLSEDRLSVTGHKGFRSAHATHGVYTGTWYCEWKVVHLGGSGHVRLGWSTKKAELQVNHC